MSSLFLIRHGQASFGTAITISLPRGIAQAEFLAKYWLQTGQEFDAVYAAR
jgi:broad specificity phosphatase PhoE